MSNIFRTTDGSVGVLTMMCAGQPRNQLSGKERNFSFSKKSRPTLEATNPPIQTVQGALPPRCKAPWAWNWPL